MGCIVVVQRQKMRYRICVVFIRRMMQHYVNGTFKLTEGSHETTLAELFDESFTLEQSRDWTNDKLT